MLQPLALLALVGCQTQLYDDYSNDDTASAPTTDTAAPEDTDVDSDTDSDSTAPPPPSSCHAVDPLEASGWVREYNVTSEGSTGTERVEGKGASTTLGGDTAFEIESKFVTPAMQLLSRHFRSCGSQGDAIWHETLAEGTVVNNLLIIPVPTAVKYRKTPTTPERYLSDVATLTGTGLWQYDYTLEIAGTTGSSGSLFGSQPNCTLSNGNPGNCVPVSGSYTALGVQQVTVPAGTFDAYWVLDERVEKWSAGGLGGGPFSWILGAMGIPGLFSTEDKAYVSQYWYAEGIGLIKEETYAGSTPIPTGAVPLVTRELTSTQGLPVP